MSATGISADRTHSGARPWIWGTGPAGFQVSMQVISAVAVLALSGRLDRAAAPVCRSALEAALGLRTPHVVLDLRRILVNQDSPLVLTLMSRMASRQGVDLFLAAPNLAVRDALDRGRLPGHRVYPRLQAALEVAAAPAHRNRSAPGHGRAADDQPLR